MSDTYFDVLQVPQDVTESEIREAHRRQLALHPNNSAQLHRIEEAYAVLVNPITRARYLKQLQARSSTPAKPPSPDPQPKSRIAPAPFAPQIEKGERESRDLGRSPGPAPTVFFDSSDAHSTPDEVLPVNLQPASPAESPSPGLPHTNRSSRGQTVMIDYSAQSEVPPKDKSQPTSATGSAWTEWRAM